MDSESTEQTELLRNIWNEMKALGQNLGGRIDATNARLEAMNNDVSGRIDATNARLERMNDDLNERIDQTNARLGLVEESLRDLGAQQLLLTRYVKNVVERHETSIDGLHGRVTHLESKSG